LVVNSSSYGDSNVIRSKWLAAGLEGSREFKVNNNGTSVESSHHNDLIDAARMKLAGMQLVFGDRHRCGLNGNRDALQVAVDRPHPLIACGTSASQPDARARTRLEVQFSWWFQ
jgi:hypothetical protein